LAARSVPWAGSRRSVEGGYREAAKGGDRPEPIFRAWRGLPVGLLVTAPTTPAGLGAQRLKRVFGIDIEACRSCGGAVRIIACIEDPVVIEKILAHLAYESG